MIIGVIAAAMTSSISASLVGEHSSGKSELANVAKLLVEDIVDQYQLVLNSLSNYFSQAVTRQTILTKFYQVDCATALRLKYSDPVISHHADAYSILCYNSRNFPCLYFHVSGVSEPEIHSELSLLIRDHMMTVHNSLVSLSDCSMIVECENEELAKMCPVMVRVPEIDEGFFREYFKNLYPQQSEEWNNSFIQGYFLLKQSMPDKVANNFTVVQQMYLRQIFLLDKRNIVRDSEVQEVLDRYQLKRNENPEEQTTFALSNSADD